MMISLKAGDYFFLFWMILAVVVYVVVVVYGSASDLPGSASDDEGEGG